MPALANDSRARPAVQGTEGDVIRIHPDDKARFTPVDVALANEQSGVANSGGESSTGNALAGVRTPSVGGAAVRPTRDTTADGPAVINRVLIALTLILVLTLCGAGVFTTLLAKDALEARIGAEARTTARSVAAIVEPLVHSGQITDLRRVVAELSSQTPGTEISISLPDGSVLAHSNTSRINVRQIPETWSTQAHQPDALATAIGTAAETVNIQGRGTLAVSVRLPTQRLSTELVGSLSVVLATAGGAALVLLTIVVRRARRPLHVLSIIGHALREYRSDTNAVALLHLDERFGQEAVSFNQLLAAAAGRRQGDLEPQGNTPPSTAKNAGGDESGSDLEQAVNIIPTGIIIMDRAGVVKLTNNMGAILVGTTVPELTGRVLSDVLTDEPILDLLASIREGRMSRRTLEVRRETAVGEAVLRVQCRALRKDDAGAALITLEDITQQRVADASRGLFVAQATHELRTPLTNMRLALETVMEDDAELPPEMTPHLNMLSGEVRRLERIVGDMLAVSEIEAGSIKLARGSIQIERLLAEIEGDHKAHADEHGVRLTFSLPPKYPQVFGDREKLAQALHNLVGNAIKYTPSGGAVTVTVCEAADGKQLQFMVADTGFGISAEDQTKLFSRFARGSDPRVAKIVGTGLGLALSREIARLHGGDISVTSELNKGSTFTLGIPLGRSEQKAAA